MKVSLEKWQVHSKEDLQLFYENFPDPLPLELEYFHPVQLPIVITEARVKMRSVQDYSVLSLLILRLFDAGITSEAAIRRISGMSEETVRAYVEKEKFLLEHIDPKTNRLTELGLQTLQLNSEGMEKPQSCQHFDSAIRVHIEPITASLIPQYMEWEIAENSQPNQEAGYFLLPPKDAVADPDFLRELNTRLVDEINARKEEHVACDILQNGNVLDAVSSLQPLRVLYRWGYLAKFAGMTYPMILLSGKKTIERANASTKATGFDRKKVLLPVTIAEDDREYLEENGITLEGVISRQEEYFSLLAQMAATLDLQMPEEEGDDPPPAPDPEPEEDDL